MTPYDYDLEREVLAWAGEDPDARGRVLRELDPAHLWNPASRTLFIAMRNAWLAGDLVHGYEIQGVEVVHSFSGLRPHHAAALNEIIESGKVGIPFSARVDDAISTLHRLLRERAVLAAAERILEGEVISDSVLTWLLNDETAA